MAERVITTDLLGATTDPVTPYVISDAGGVTSYKLEVFADSGYMFTERGQIIRYDKDKNTGALSKPFNVFIPNLPTDFVSVEIIVNHLSTADAHFVIKPFRESNDFNYDDSGLVGLKSNYESTVIEGGLNYIEISLVEGFSWYRSDSEKIAYVIYSMNGVSETVYPSLQDVLNGFIAIQVDVISDLVITGRALPIETSTDVNITLNLTNASSDYTADTIPVGTNEITFFADDGYEFRGVSEIHYSGNVIPTLFYPTGTEYTLTLDVPINQDIEITLEALLVIETLGNFTNIFRTNRQQLGDLSLERFRAVEGVDPEYDYGQMIMNIIEIPFPIPQELIADTVNIPLGRYQTNVQSELISNYRLMINIGDIEVPEVHGNVLDYRNTDIYLHVPYLERITLPIEYVMGQTISIRYVFDLYTGECNVMVKSSMGDGLIIYNDVEPMFNKIPFIQYSTNRSNSKTGILMDNNIRNAYIEVIRNIPVVTDSGVNTNKNQKLEDLTGYVEIDTIRLISSATVNEQRDINNLLKSGVFINE